jgi:hypothetical protein
MITRHGASFPRGVHIRSLVLQRGVGVAIMEEIVIVLICVGDTV